MVKSLNDEEVLHRLADAALRRQMEEAEHGREWDALTDEVMAELDSEAFGASFQAGVARQWRAMRPAEKPPEAAPVDHRGAAREAPGRRARRWAAPLAAGLALFALAIFWLLRGPLIEPGPGPEKSGGALPEYQVELLGASSQRSEHDLPPDSARRIVVVPGFRFELLLRPERPVAREIGVRFFVGGADGWLERFRAAEARARIETNGVIVLGGLAAEDWRFLEPGDFTLYAVVAPPSLLPSAEDLHSHFKSDAAAPAEWRLSSQEIRLVAPP